MRAFLSALGLMVLLVAGCGDDDEAPATAGVQANGAVDEAELASLVNRLYDATVEGDGEEACSYMTPRGQRLFPRLAAGFEGSDVERGLGCADAVRAFIDSFPPGEGEPLNGGGFTSQEVLVDRKAGAAQAQCRFRGAVFLKELDGEWLVDFPYCFD